MADHKYADDCHFGRFLRPRIGDDDGLSRCKGNKPGYAESSNHLIRAEQDGLWHVYIQRPRRFQVDDEVEPHASLERQVGRLGATCWAHVASEG